LSFGLREPIVHESGALATAPLNKSATL